MDLRMATAFDSVVEILSRDIGLRLLTSGVNFRQHQDVRIVKGRQKIVEEVSGT